MAAFECQLRAIIIFAASTFAIVAAGSNGASAQTPSILPSGCTSTFAPNAAGFDTGNSVAAITAGIAGVTNSISSVINTMNTSFIAQGNAFVAGLPNPQADQTSGGVWGRLIGGRSEESATSTFNGNVSGGFFAPAGAAPAPGQVSCASGVRLDYGGFQLGQDIARLNIGGGGATLHVGVTGGYGEFNAQNQGGSPFTGNFEVPFAGLYAAYTNGPFFADIATRGNLYQMSLSSTDAVLSNQRLNAVGGTVSGSAGYRLDLGKNWFFEPSASAIYSKVNIDTLNMAAGRGSTQNVNLSVTPQGTVQFNPDESILGRLGARVGTTLNSPNVVWQPFAAASIWHEFAGNTTANYTSTGPTIFSVPTFAGSVSSTRVGTYGQYSVGVAAQAVDAPLVGYLRLDYRNGSNIESAGFNGGLRYNFDPRPGLVRPVGVFKAPVQTVAVYDWTGFYAGAFTGAAWGSNDWFFPQVGGASHPRIAGALLGGNAGYNWQFGRWVVGVEGDVAATNAKGGQSCIGTNNVVPGFVQNCNDDLKWVATATAKAGYAWDQVLVYGKAGGAWTENKLDISCNDDATFFLGGLPFRSPCSPANNPTVAAQNLVATVGQFGWTIGTGFELALTPAWSAKAEYDYINFGSKNNIVLPGTTAVNLKQDFNEVKVGINYHFGKDEVVVASAVPVKAPPAPVFNWTGVYVGAAVADRLSFDTWQTSAIAEHCQICQSRGGVPDPTTTPSSFFSSNPQGRLDSGYNWQLPPKWVLSVEGDVGFGDSQMTQGGIPGTFGNGIRNSAASAATDAQLVDSSSVKMGWDGTIRGRLGTLVTPTVLFYGTGGVAFQEVSVSASCTAIPGNPFSHPISWCTNQGFGGGTGISKSQTFSSVRTGWTAGFGIEGVLVGNWLGRFEARYADFGYYKNTFFAGTGDAVATNVRVQTATALAGVSYKFDPSGLLAAKY